MNSTKVVILVAVAAMIGALANVQPSSAKGHHGGWQGCAPTQKRDKATGQCFARNDPRFHKHKGK